MVTAHSLEDCLNNVQQLYAGAPSETIAHLKREIRDRHQKLKEWKKDIYYEVSTFAYEMFQRGHVIPEADLLPRLSVDLYSEIIVFKNPEFPNSGSYLDFPSYPDILLFGEDQRSGNIVKLALDEGRTLFQDLEKYHISITSRTLREFSRITGDIINYPELSEDIVRSIYREAFLEGNLSAAAERSHYSVERKVESLQKKVAITLEEIKFILSMYIQGMSGGKPVALLSNEGYDYSRNPLISPTEAVILKLPAQIALGYRREDNYRRYRMLAALQAAALKYGTYSLTGDNLEKTELSVRHLQNWRENRGARVSQGDLFEHLQHNLQLPADAASHLLSIFSFLEQGRLKNRLDRHNPALKLEMEELTQQEYFREQARRKREEFDKKRPKLKSDTLQQRIEEIGYQLSWAVMDEHLAEQIRDPKAAEYYSWITDKLFQPRSTVVDSWNTTVRIFKDLNPAPAAKKKKKEKQKEGDTEKKEEPKPEEKEEKPKAFPPSSQIRGFNQIGTDFSCNSVLGLSNSIHLKDMELKQKSSVIDADPTLSKDHAASTTFYYEEFDHTANRTYEFHCRVHEHGQGQRTKPSEYELRKVLIDPERIDHIKKALQLLKPEGRVKIRNQPSGDLDIDKAVRYLIDVKAGIDPDSRMYYRTEVRERDVAELFSIDVSGSTASYHSRECLAQQKRTIDAMKEGLIHLLWGASELGDSYAVMAYSGRSRQNVSVWMLKEFGERISMEDLEQRILNLVPDSQNRCGAVYRHGIREKLLKQPNTTKLFIDLNDGIPEDEDAGKDIPAYKEKYAIEDTRRALDEAIRQGIIAHSFSFVQKKFFPRLQELWGEQASMIVDSRDFEAQFLEWFIGKTQLR